MLAILTVGGLALQPAAAHIGTPGELWTQHLRARADVRYLQKTKVYVSAPCTLAALAGLTATRACPAGWQAIGGGVDFDAAAADVQVISSAPTVGGSNLFAANQGQNPAAGGWRVTMHNDGVLVVDGVVGVVRAR